MGRIYLVRSFRRHKVGVTEQLDLERRLGAIRRMNAYELMVVKIWELDNATQIEQAVHRQLVRYHKHDEWFEFPRGEAVMLVEAAILQVQESLASLSSDDPILRKIQELRRVGLSKKNILWETHAARPGKTQRWKDACHDYDQAMGEIK